MASKFKDPLLFTIPISMMLHASLYAMGFRVPDFPTAPSSPTLDITIVIPQDTEEPEEADFMANANQEGSGSLDEKSRIESKFAANEEILSPGADEFTAEKSVAEVIPKADPQILTTKGKSDTSVDKLPEEKPQEEAPVKTFENSEETLEIAKLMAETAEEESHYARRPRIGFVDSLSAKGSIEAEYINKWSKKLERIGNINFPQQALKLNLSGTLILNSLIDRAGRVIEIQVTVSSGSDILDDAAENIVKLASPYEPLPNELREKYDQLNITRTLVFSKAEGEKEATFSSN